MQHTRNTHTSPSWHCLQPSPSPLRQLPRPPRSAGPAARAQKDANLRTSKTSLLLSSRDKARATRGCAQSRRAGSCPGTAQMRSCTWSECPPPPPALIPTPRSRERCRMPKNTSVRISSLSHLRPKKTKNRKRRSSEILSKPSIPPFLRSSLHPLPPRPHRLGVENASIFVVGPYGTETTPPFHLPNKNLPQRSGAKEMKN